MKRLLSVFMLMLLVVFTYGCTDETTATDFNFTADAGQAFDLGIANEEKLIEMLKREGKIADDATPDVAEEALRQYLNARAKSVTKEKGQFDSQKEKIKANFNNKYTEGLFNGLGNKLGQAHEVSNVVEESWDGSVTTDQILVLLIDFPDFRNNEISSEYADLYYDDFTKEHYEEMLFGEDGYVGPNGENLISMRQYYEAQSNGSYTVDGTVAGWYTANYPAAAYGNNVNGSARALVYEALLNAIEDPTIDLSQFDKEDRYDLDGDGNYREPDGIIDHLMIVHAGVGEEAGGGALGEDAIWSHSWDLGGLAPLPGTSADVPYWGGIMVALDYTMQPEDGAAGVFSHEYGHDLGLPDEYDTQYTGNGEPVSYWSVMSSGSWAGIISGTEPTGFSPYAKLQLQASLGGNWLSGSYIHVDAIPETGIEALLDQASSNGTNNNVLIIGLPDKENIINIPYSGEYEYYSGNGNELDNSMLTTLDLTGATTAKLQFKTWYEIEQDWDYASVGVYVDGEWISVEGNITTEFNPNGNNPGHGITGYSNGWVEAEFDLSQFAGQEIYVGFNYLTDLYVAETGFFADDITITVDGNVVMFDDAEGESQFELIGFEKFSKEQGVYYTEQFYLVEWRNHQGVDEALAHIGSMQFDPGMLIWYVDMSYNDNWTGAHPGDGYLGVVDADQHVNRYSNHAVASTRYQVHDAAFSLEKSDKMYLGSKSFYLKDYSTQVNPMFDDSLDYSNGAAADAGRNVPTYGLKIRVIGESEDRSVAKILLFK
ncbi:immune inhibitor A [Mycoplasmatota bacterium WC44]